MSEAIATHTTVSGSSVAQWVTQHHGLAVRQCHLIRRGLNDNYALQLADGTRWVARLYSVRPRGACNVEFEVALLTHLAALGVSVAAPRRAANGRGHALVRLAEGERALAVFRFAPGEVPDTLDEFALTGRTLAALHDAARSYCGPSSLYILDGHHLAGRTLNYLAQHPEVDAALLEGYRSLVASLLRQLDEVQPSLTRVLCHGDSHGFNNHVSTDATGRQIATFFDFDDAGPGYLAYDLGVLRWSYLCRNSLKAPDETLRERWAVYLGGYRAAGGRLTDADLTALPLFIQLRHLWNMGEAVGRLHHWGTANASESWLKKQLTVFGAWAETYWQA